MSIPRKPPLANPGEVWMWMSDKEGSVFLVIQERFRNRHGQMYDLLSVDRKTLEFGFMSYAAFNGWERLV